MEPNGGGGGGRGVVFSSMNSSILGLELPLHQNPTNNPHQLHPQMVSYLTSTPKNPFPTKPKQPQQTNISDEEDPGFSVDETNNGDSKKKISPWQRMKWTDAMVRLLIISVFYIGDENGSEISDLQSGKKKPVGLLQKKGKWKSVSRAMMEKGFYVSPQQCEDKFNDLNKRYKRVNDILGKGTACKVVENQNLLDSMDLTPKLKEEVRKLLNSKHLFFREMCAYHNSCRHGGSSAVSGCHQSPEPEPGSVNHQQQQQQQQRCLHSTTTAVVVEKSGELDDDDDEDDDDSEEDEEEEEDEENDGGSRGQEEEDETERKRARKGTMQEMQQLTGEINGIIQDGGKSQWEKKQWMRGRLIQLEEEQVNYQSRALELEKQRLKWMKFRSKKERDMERVKLENEKRGLENERMVLFLKQKEIDLVDSQHHHQQHSSNRRGDPSSITG